MPVYVYHCPEGHKIEISLPMGDARTVLCPACAKTMYRVPQLINVNWNGFPPSKEPERAKEVQDIIDPEQIARRRDEYERNHNG